MRVVTCTSHVEAFATGIKVESSKALFEKRSNDQGDLNLNCKSQQIMNI